MERTLGVDVHAQSCMLAVISPAGKRLKDWGIETNGQALIEAIRTVPGHKHLCIEEGTQSAWLYEILRPHVQELVVATVRRSRGQKSDRNDAYQRAEELLRGTIDRRVFKAPQTYARLRELTLRQPMPPRRPPGKCKTFCDPPPESPRRATSAYCTPCRSNPRLLAFPSSGPDKSKSLL